MYLLRESPNAFPDEALLDVVFDWAQFGRCKPDVVWAFAEAMRF